MNNMIKTGIFATPEDIDTLKSAIQTSGMDINVARQNPEQYCHELALKHGLPEIPGQYGILPSGEFVRSDD